MGEFLRIMIMLQAAMLSPIWVPLLGVALGKLTDQVRREQVTPAQEAVRAAKARSEVRRRETAGQRIGRHRSVPGPVQDEYVDTSVAA